MQATGATFHSNCHFFIAKLPDLSLLVKYMINDSIFQEKLGCIGVQNNTFISIFPDLFYIGSAYLSNRIALSRYSNFGRSNWDIFNLKNGYMSDTANNDSPKSEPEDLDRSGDNSNNLNKFDSIYD